MSNKIDFTFTIRGPQIDVEDEHCVFDITEKGQRSSFREDGSTNSLAVNFLARLCISDEELHAWGRSDGTSILITKSTHSCTARLLDNLELIFPSILYTSNWQWFWLGRLNPKRRRVLLLVVRW